MENGAKLKKYKKSEKCEKSACKGYCFMIR